MAKDFGYSLEGRYAPVPTGASPELQKIVIENPTPDVAEWQQISPENPDDWNVIISQMDEAEVLFIAELLQKLPSKVNRSLIGGVPVYRISPAEIDPQHENHLFVLLHGGAYVAGAGEAGLTEALLIADRARIQVLAIDYRMPPHYPFPAGLEDVVTVYTNLLSKQPANSIALGGSSAGGGLVLAAVQRFTQFGLELPGAVLAGTPWSDLSKTGDSYYSNEGLDRALVSYEGVLAAAAKLYAGNYDLRNPLVSPIYGEFEGFPPVFLVTGSRDLFLSCTIRVHAKLRSAAVAADLLVFEGQSHGDYALLVDSPESELYYTQLSAFLRQHLR